MTSPPPGSASHDAAPAACKRPGSPNTLPPPGRGRARQFCSDDCARRYHNDARIPATAPSIAGTPGDDPLAALETLTRQAAVLIRAARDQAAYLDPANVRVLIADAGAARHRAEAAAVTAQARAAEATAETQALAEALAAARDAQHAAETAASSAHAAARAAAADLRQAHARRPRPRADRRRPARRRPPRPRTRRRARRRPARRHRDQPRPPGRNRRPRPDRTGPGRRRPRTRHPPRALPGPARRRQRPHRRRAGPRRTRRNPARNRARRPPPPHQPAHRRTPGRQQRAASRPGQANPGHPALTRGWGQIRVLQPVTARPQVGPDQSRTVGPVQLDRAMRGCDPTGSGLAGEVTGGARLPGGRR